MIWIESQKETLVIRFGSEVYLEHTKHHVQDKQS